MESKILEILYSYRYTKKQVVDEIAKHMKNPNVRQDLIHILDILPSEINTNDMILIIKEMLKYIVSCISVNKHIFKISIGRFFINWKFL